MRFFVSFAAAAVAFSLTSAVFACGGQVSVPIERPTLVVQQPTEAPQLVQARLLERSASDKQMQAARDEQRAAVLRGHARRLRMMANEVDGVDRANLELAAGQLGLRANQSMRRAQLLHSQARQLRARAQRLRMQSGLVNQASHRMRPPMRRRGTLRI